MFKFIYEFEDNRNELIVHEDGLKHMDVALWFNQFLRGCGYVYDGEYALITKEEEQALAQYYRQRDHDAFIQSAFGDDLNDNEAGPTFPVI